MKFIHLQFVFHSNVMRDWSRVFILLCLNEDYRAKIRFSLEYSGVSEFWTLPGNFSFGTDEWRKWLKRKMFVIIACSTTESAQREADEQVHPLFYTVIFSSCFREQSKDILNLSKCHQSLLRKNISLSCKSS